MTTQQTVHALFEEQVLKAPKQIAVVYEKEEWTYQALNEKANQLAHYLQKLGVEAETRIAVCMERSVEFLIAVFGILKAGAAYVPLDAANPKERLLFILNDNKNPILIINPAFKEKFTDYPGKIIAFQEELQEIGKYPSTNLSSLSRGGHLAYAIYTSGSTGKPKGVLVEHQSVINYSVWFADTVYRERDLRVDFSSNPAFDIAVTVSIVPLMLGLTVVICSDEVKKNSRHYINYLNVQQVSFIKLTPSYFRLLIHEVTGRQTALSSLRIILFGGEPLSRADCQTWLSLYPRQTLFNEYGPTETTVAITLYEIHKEALDTMNLTVPIGKPGPNITCCLLDENLNEVNSGEIGELHIGGICLARGYLNQPELTEKKFIKNPRHVNSRLYKTGDLCRSLPDGTLEYIERIDYQVKIRGYRVEPGEIENHLLKFAGIKQAIVIARRDESELRLIGYYILQDEVKTIPEQSEIRQFLQRKLPDYMVPSAFVKINSLPLTENGKLDRQALPLPKIMTDKPYVAPKTQLEMSLAALWCEELGIKKVSIEDDFFELGGHSLSVARVISKIALILKKEVSLQAFYNASTIKKLAVVVSQSEEVKQSQGQSAHDNENSSFPLGDFQLMLWLSSLFESRARHLNVVARKRLQGRLDSKALTFAFRALLKKHEALLYQVYKFRPAQIIRKEVCFHLQEKCLTSIGLKDRETFLEQSLYELYHDNRWRRDEPMLKVRWFRLEDIDELQIAMPHLLADDISLQTIFTDLSTFYNEFCEGMASEATGIEVDTHYRAYVLQEHHALQKNLAQNKDFWKAYLNDTHLFSFPSKEVVHNAAPAFSYSTYLEIPEKSVKNLQSFCAAHCISLNDGLCAALGLALIKTRGAPLKDKEARPVFINIVKTTREKQVYDATIGCFLRLDAIKLNLSQNKSLTDLARQVRQSVLKTAPYQHCPSLVKLGSIPAFSHSHSVFKHSIMRFLISAYAKLTRLTKLHQAVLSFCERLSRFERRNNFLITLNVRNNFLTGNEQQKKREKFFNLNTKTTRLTHYDLLEIDYCFDVCFLRDSQNTPFVVISTNLKPQFRQRIANEIVRILSFEMAVAKTREMA